MTGRHLAGGFSGRVCGRPIKNGVEYHHIIISVFVVVVYCMHHVQSIQKVIFA